MSTTSSTDFVPGARDVLAAADPTLVLDGLKGDGTKGEPVVTGDFAVVDVDSAQFPGVIKNRTVTFRGEPVRVVMVAAADVLTHAKAEAALRTVAVSANVTTRGGTAPPKRTGKDKKEVGS